MDFSFRLTLTVSVMARIAPLPFGRLLQRYRSAAGLTQDQLAERAGLSARSISDLERSIKHRPHDYTVQRLARALDLAPDERALFEAAAQHLGIPPVHDDHRDGRPSPAASGPGIRGGGALSPNLPQQPTAFVGREAELRAVAELLCRSDIRLLTLTGPGGTGKTRLALQVSSQVADAFPDGVHFVPLASTTDPALVSPAVATVLDVPETGGHALVDALKNHIGARKVLLVLDNFEHVLVAAPLTTSLLTSCPGLKILVTSRAVLRLGPEHTYVVPPLSLPDGHHASDLNSLSRCDAVALFLARAQAARADFALTDDIAPTVADICLRLDGLPLAIELAAARLRLFPPRALLARLSTSLAVLTGGARDLPARQQTLRGAIDWSYSLLDPPAQDLFARLAVFPGGCTLEALEEVCSETGDLNVLETVASLIDQSLVRQVDVAADEPRLVMLATIREYAQERLQERNDGPLLRRRHAEYYRELAEEAEPEVRGGTPQLALERLEHEHANLRAALGWARDNREVALGLRLAVALAPFFELRGHLSEGRAWLRDLLAIQDGSAPELEAAALLAAAHLAEAQGDLRGAIALGERSLDCHRELGQWERVAGAGAWLGRVVSRHGDPDRAASLCQDAVTVARALGKPCRIADLLLDLAWVEQWRGSLDHAREACEESLELYRGVGDRTGVARALELLTWVTESQGDVGRAHALSAENLALLRAMSGQDDVRARLDELAMRARSRADYQQGIALLQESEAMSLALGDQRRAAHTRLSLALLSRQQGDYERAVRLYQDSLAVFQSTDDLGGVAHALLGLGDVARDTGEAQQVIDRCQESLALFRELGDARFVGYCLHNLGLAAAWQGNAERGDALLAESLTVQRMNGGTDDVTEVCASLGLVALQRGDYPRARRMFADGLKVGPVAGTPWLVAAAIALEGMASVDAALGREERAACLFGAAETIEIAAAAPIWPSFHRVYATYRGMVRMVLGDELFTVVWQEGHNMPLAAAIAFALDSHS